MFKILSTKYSSTSGLSRYILSEHKAKYKNNLNLKKEKLKKKTNI